MARGEATQVKVHYKGKDEDFIVFVDDAKAAKDWKTDKTIPLAQVVSAFKIFVTGKYVYPSKLPRTEQAHRNITVAFHGLVYIQAERC